MFILLAIVFTFILFLSFIEYRRVSFNRRFKHVPGFKEYPVIGSPFMFTTKLLSDFEKGVKLLCSKPVNKGTYAGIYAFTVYDPDISRQILMSPNFIDRPYFFKFGQLPWGLLTSNDDHWHKVKKVMSPSFNQVSVNYNTPIFQKYSRLICDELAKHIDAEEFDVAPLLLKFVIPQLIETQFDVNDFKATKDDLEILPVFSETMTFRGINPFYYLDIIFRFTNLYQLSRKWHSYSESILQPIIDAKQTALSKQENLGRGNRRYFIYDFLKSDLPPEAVMDNAKLIIPSGFESTVVALGNTLLMLAMHPEVDKKLYAEIQEFCQDGVEIDHKLLKEMEYLDMVFKEVLRLFPSVPGTVRSTMKDTLIDRIGVIPKRTVMVISALSMHRDTNLWGPKAHLFDPDHFLPENVAKRHPHCYIPFSAGPRNCVGIHYANLNIKLLLVRILSKYRFTTSLKYEDLTLRFQLIIRLNCPYLLKVHTR